MNAMSRHALNAYTQAGVEANVTSASPHKLILLLLTGAMEAVATAKYNMGKPEVQNIAAKGEAISKAHAIISDGLKLSLDVKAGGEIAENLSSLYDYMCALLLHANIHNKPEMLDEVTRLLGELKGAWESIGKQPAAAASQAGVEQLKQNATSYGKV